MTKQTNGVIGNRM